MLPSRQESLVLNFKVEEARAVFMAVRCFFLGAVSCGPLPPARDPLDDILSTVALAQAV